MPLTCKVYYQIVIVIAFPRHLHLAECFGFPAFSFAVVVPVELNIKGH